MHEVKLSQLLRALSQVADLAEAKAPGHGQRMALMALQLGAATLAPAAAGNARLAELAVAALLHDLGLSSVSYNLFQQVGGRDRELLAAYPSVADGLFGLPAGHGLEALALPLLRHTDVGVRMLQQLGYGNGVTEALAWHHARYDGRGRPAGTPSGEHIPHGAQLIALVDQLDTATWHLETAEARRETALALLATPHIAGGLVSPALAALAAETLASAALWEEIFFLDAAEARLDALFEHTYGVLVPFDGLEAHLRVLAQCVDAQSPYTSGHTFEVARLAGRIGERLGLEPEGLNRLHVASLVHGAGRLGISSAILEKPGGLSEDEFVQLHTYPELTREALSPLAPLRDLVDEACTHREKLDGSGYPEGILGDEIPLVGRILGVADTFIALVSERPYRPAYSHSRALAIIQAESARLFDGLVADALEAVYREGL